MRGPYESLKADKVDELFRGATEFEYEDDLHTDDREELAVTLKPTTILASGYRVAAAGTLTDGTDIDYYRLRAPATTGRSAPWVLTVTINSASVNGIVPQVLMSNSAMTPLKTQIIAHDADTITIQATGIVTRRGVTASRFGTHWWKLSPRSAVRSRRCKLDCLHHRKSVGRHPRRQSQVVYRSIASLWIHSFNGRGASRARDPQSAQVRSFIS